MIENKRGAIRINSLNLSYIGIDENNETVKQAIGRTLNISESGILLETHFSIDTGQIVSITLALEDDLINVRGEVIYSRAGNEEKFETGVKFFEMVDESHQTLKAYIQDFKNQT